jgi:arylsulfatase A-like enzyme
VAASDQVVSMLLEVIEREKLRDETTIIVTGDHGNTEVHTQIRPNVWLIEEGLRGAKLENRDWKATFFGLGGSAFLRVQGDTEKIAGAVRRVIERLPATVRETFRIVERAELDLLGSDPEAPFALAAAKGFVIDDRGEAPDMHPNPGMIHGHHPDEPDMHTGFVARGPGIRAGASIPMLPLTSIAPIVAELLGLDFDAPDGIVYPGVLE